MALSRCPRFTGLQASFLVGSALVFFGLPWYCINSDTGGHAKFQPIGTVIGYLGQCADKSGNHKRARRLLSCALKAHLGDISDDAGYAYFAERQCRLLSETNRFEKALKLETRINTIYTKLYGSDSCGARASATRIAADLMYLNRPVESYKVALANLKMEAAQNVTTSPFEADNLNYLAYDSLVLGKINEADKAASKVFASANYSAFMNSKRWVELSDVLAVASLRRGNFAEAQERYAEQIARQKRDMPDQALWIGTNQALYAYCCEKAGMKSEACSIADEVYSQEAELENSPNCESSAYFHDVALLHQSQGHFDQAERLYKLALKLEKSEVPSDDILTLLTWHKLADVYFAEGKTGEADKLCTEILNIRTRLLGTDSADTAASAELLGRIKEKLGDKDCAFNLHVRAYYIYREQLGDCLITEEAKGTVKRLCPIYPCEESRENEIGPSFNSAPDAFSIHDDMDKLLEQGGLWKPTWTKVIPSDWQQFLQQLNTVQ